MLCIPKAARIDAVNVVVAVWTNRYYAPELSDLLDPMGHFYRKFHRACILHNMIRQSANDPLITHDVITHFVTCCYPLSNILRVDLEQKRNERIIKILSAARETFSC